MFYNVLFKKLNVQMTVYYLRNINGDIEFVFYFVVLSSVGWFAHVIHRAEMKYCIDFQGKKT